MKTLLIIIAVLSLVAVAVLLCFGYMEIAGITLDKAVDIAAIVGTVAAIISVVIAAVGLCRKKTASSSSQPGQSTHIGDISVNSGVISTGDNATIHQTTHIGITLEQYEAGLKRREKAVRVELKDHYDETLDRELAAINAKQQNLEQSYQNQKALLKTTQEKLEQFREQIPQKQLQQAQDLLATGDTSAAEGLLENIQSQGQANAATAAYQLGKLAESRIDYRKAMQHYDQAVSLAADNADYLQAAAIVACELGFYAKAESLYECALVIEKKLGQDSPQVASILANLANLYQSQGQYVKAEWFYRRALEIQEKVLCQDHLEIGRIFVSLGNLYQSQGYYATSERLYHHSLEISKKLLPDYHPEVASTLGNLANLYQAQGQNVKAERLYQHILVIQKKTLGESHLDVARTMNNLANTYISQGQYIKAENLYQQSVMLKKKKLDPDHPEVSHTLGNLANLYQKQGQYAKAERLHQRILPIQKKSVRFKPSNSCLNFG